MGQCGTNGTANLFFSVNYFHKVKAVWKKARRKGKGTWRYERNEEGTILRQIIFFKNKENYEGGTISIRKAFDDEFWTFLGNTRENKETPNIEDTLKSI